MMNSPWVWLFLLICFSVITNAQKYELIDEINGQKISQVSAINEDQSGNIWFSTNNGVYRYDSKHLKPIGQFTQDSIPPKITNINIIKSDSSGNMWMGGDGGILIKYNSNTL